MELVAVNPFGSEVPKTAPEAAQESLPNGANPGSARGRLPRGSLRLAPSPKVRVSSRCSTKAVAPLWEHLCPKAKRYLSA